MCDSAAVREELVGQCDQLLSSLELTADGIIKLYLSTFETLQ